MLKDKSIIGTIIIGLIIIISTIALLVGFSQAGYVNNDANITDKDLTWQITNWGVDNWFNRNPNDLVGKSLNVYVAPAGQSESITINEKSAYCLSHQGETQGGKIYTITNVLDLDVEMGENIIGKPGIVKIYGGTEGKIEEAIAGNKLIYDENEKIKEGREKYAIALAYLAANAYENGETNVNEKAGIGLYKVATMFEFSKNFNELIKKEEERRNWARS